MVKNIDTNCYKSFFFVSDAEQSTLKSFSLSHKYNSLKSHENDKHSSLFYQNFNNVEKDISNIDTNCYKTFFFFT